MEIEPRLDRSGSGTLDGPPPSPSMKRAKTMLDSGSDSGGGLGEMASTPQAKALMGLKMVQQGTQQIALVVPGLAQQLGDFLNQLQMVTVSAVANMSQGGPSAVPGMSPMPAPPPPMPQMPPPGAAPAPTPGVPGM